MARALAARGALAEGITAATAADTIYTLMAPEVHHILTVERAWSADREASQPAEPSSSLPVPHPLLEGEKMIRRWT